MLEGLPTLGRFSGAVEYVQYLHLLQFRFYSVGDYVAGIGNNKFTGAMDATGVASSK